MSGGQAYASPFDETLLTLSRVIAPEMAAEQVAVQALNGVEFPSADEAVKAIRRVAAAVHIVRHGPARARPVLVSG